MASHSRSKNSIITKLDSAHIALSPKMRWIIDALTGRDHGSRGPRGESPMPLNITSDGFVTAGSMFLGSADDLERNIEGVLTTVGATKTEHIAFGQLKAGHITDWRTR